MSVEDVRRALERRAVPAGLTNPDAPATPHNDNTPAGSEAWREDLERKSNGAIRCNLRNAVTAFTSAPAWQGVLAFDQFRNQPVVCKAIPSFALPTEAPDRPRPLEDQDVILAQHWLQAAAMSEVSKTTVHDALVTVAQQRRYHPVRDHLGHMTWDGEERLDRWLTNYLDAPDKPYTRLVGRMWLIQAVARIYEPGCQADHALVLEGEQGVGKSTAGRILGGEWYGDNLPSVEDQVRAQQYLRGKWIIEVAELQAFSRAQTAQIKSFITTRTEQYIPKYGRREVQEPRQCVFLCTTNERAYLRDETGGRRFWPVPVGSIAINDLLRDRDQLLAEAVAAYKSGEEWWPLPETERTIIQPEQEARYEGDPWEGPIKRWLEEHASNHVEVAGVAEGALDLQRSKIGSREQRRITAILHELGWTPKRVKGRRKWAAPNPPQPDGE